MIFCINAMQIDHKTYLIKLLHLSLHNNSYLCLDQTPKSFKVHDSRIRRRARDVKPLPRTPTTKTLDVLQVQRFNC